MKKTVLLLMFAFYFFTYSAQTWDWAKTFGGNSYDYGQCISTDANGNSYVTGYFQSPAISFGSTVLTNTDYTNMYIAKFDASGNVVWAKEAVGGGLYYERGSGIKTDANGNSYVTGYFESPSITFGSFTLTNNGGNSTGDFFIVKYDSSGNVVWARSAGGTDADDGEAISLDAMGNVYVIGTFNSPTITFGSTTLTNAGSTFVCDFFIAKYDSDGNVLWAKRAGGTDDDIGWGIATDANGNSYVTGSFRSSSITFGSTTLTNNTTQYEDVFVVKYNSSGTVVWAKSYGGNSYDSGWGISVDGSGNSYVTGYFQSPTITFGSTTLTNVDNTGFTRDFFIEKNDASGNPVWAKSGGGTDYDYGFGITTDTNGNSFVIGDFASASFQLGSYTFHNHDTINFTNDIFIAKYNSAGTILWADSYGGTNYDGAASICRDINGDIFITGSYASNSISFGNNTITNSDTNSTEEIFVAKLNPVTGINEIENGTNSISLYPNPTTGIFTLSYNSVRAQNFVPLQLLIYDVLGQEVYHQPINNSTQSTINVTQLSNGVYFYQLTNNKETYRGKFVKE